jgi:hypothetical protein
VEVAEARVKGRRAIWTTGPYVLEVGDAQGVGLDMRRLVRGHALIWTEGALTYRLETDQDLDEAIRIAESLVPVDGRE